LKVSPILESPMIVKASKERLLSDKPDVLKLKYYACKRIIELIKKE